MEQLREGEPLQHGIENTREESSTTPFFGVYDDACRKLRYANCGHVLPMILCADGSLQRLTSTATVVGLFPKWEGPIEEVQLHSGGTGLFAQTE
jgi:serine phosphatase RsbU (regulator of sigma subunit)